MEVTPSGIEIEPRRLQFLKALFGILVMPEGRMTELRFVRSAVHSKAPWPMEVTLPGRVAEAREVRLKAQSPMVVTLPGSAIETRLQQLLNAWLAMEVTPPGTSTWPCASGLYRQQSLSSLGTHSGACPVHAPSANSSMVQRRVRRIKTSEAQRWWPTVACNRHGSADEACV